MTDRKDFKRRVRARQARTGETYLTARHQVLAGREPVPEPTPPAVPVIEVIDVSEPATRLGLRCRVVMTSTLVAEVDRELVLERIHTALVGTEADPATHLLRAVALRGERPPNVSRERLMVMRRIELGDGVLQRFLARARAGIGGVSERGNMIALSVSDVTVLCRLTVWPAHGDSEREPALFVSGLDIGLDAIAL